MPKQVEQDNEKGVAFLPQVEEARTRLVRESLRQLLFAARPVGYATTTMRELVWSNRTSLVLSLGAVAAARHIWRTRFQRRVLEKIEAAREEFLAKRRINETRRRLAGPLLSAAIDADRHIRMMLAYGEANYFRSDFDEKPEVVIMSCMYELSSESCWRALSVSVFIRPLSHQSCAVIEQERSVHLAVLRHCGVQLAKCAVHY
mmetsp:Transcript_22893/g.40744  ORF Transcript_22893/g.40744 Transcript_22893/m.40744 type:complete len:203 (-) Transcript_22893:1004-1612(-)